MRGAQFISNTAGWLRSVAAQWLMRTVTSSVTYVALVQAAASLPVLLFAVVVAEPLLRW
jgi:hypothetical protein